MKFDKAKITRSLTNFGTTAKARIDKLAERAQETWQEHSPMLKQRYDELKTASEEFAKATGSKANKSAQGIVDRVAFSSERMRKLQDLVRYQGGYYRELCRKGKAIDILSLGGESLAVLLAGSQIPFAIQSAYEAAYPNKAETDHLADQLNSLYGDELTGLLAGIKGKLFEQQYADYLNDGNLPDGYSAQIANAANQPGWDIAIEGPNKEIVEVIQAKATDSVGYVVAALEQNPQIDVVTTEEVYSHLLMSGVSESMITNSGISNASLEDALAEGVNAADISLDFSPPWFTLGLIAFTTYKAEDLTLFEKARSAGDRTGKAYLSYLVGGTLAAVTNTWWLGVVGTVGSRFLADEGARRRAIFDRLNKAAKTNGEVIAKLENFLQSA